jgi:hypothetical protein
MCATFLTHVICLSSLFSSLNSEQCREVYERHIHPTHVVLQMVVIPRILAIA